MRNTHDYTDIADKLCEMYFRLSCPIDIVNQ